VSEALEGLELLDVLSQLALVSGLMAGLGQEDWQWLVESRVVRHLGPHACLDLAPVLLHHDAHVVQEAEERVRDGRVLVLLVARWDLAC
jgi:hypothetical protein